LSYEVIYIDPPWKYNKRKKGTVFGAGVTDRYTGGCMTYDELVAFKPVIDGFAAVKCMMYMWATGAKFDEAMDLMRAWLFDYCTIAFVWEKLSKKGKPTTKPGNYTSQECEYVLLGAKERIKPAVKLVRQVIREPVREHSRKPDEARRRIERMYPTQKKIEIFATEHAAGWDSYGYEVGKYGLVTRDELLIHV